MKIQKSRVYTADIYEVGYQTWNETNDKLIDVEPQKLSANVVCIKFKNLYVPIYHCKNALQYLDLSMSVSLLDERFLYDDDITCNTYKRNYLQNVKPLYKEEGKVSLKELVEVQKQNVEEDDTFAPMC